jgi:hypothetical protein
MSTLTKYEALIIFFILVVDIIAAYLLYIEILVLRQGAR